MMRRLILGGLGVVLAATAGCATVPNAVAQTAPAADDAASAIGTIFDTRTAKYFGDATVPLKAYLAAAVPPPVGPQHFCIIGYDPGPDDNGADGKMAYVHWREGQRLILWNSVSDPAYFEDSIKWARSNLDLTKDVVATEADINGSTYLVARAWVDEILRSCAARGAQYTVSR